MEYKLGKKYLDTEVRAIQLDMLKRAIDCARNNNLSLSLGFGTLIGAIREKGYIPWDDNINLLILEEDVDKFVQNFECLNNERIVVTNLLPNCKKAYYTLCMIEKTDTTCLIRGEDYHRGIEIHMSVMNRSSGKKLENIHLNLCAKTEYIKSLEFDPKRSQIKNRVLKILKYFAFKIDLKKYYLRVKKRNQLKDSGLVKTFYIPYKPYDSFPKKWFTEIMYVPFEDMMAPVSKYYDIMLKTFYGDYMTPPPKSEQIAKHGRTFYEKII